MKKFAMIFALVAFVTFAASAQQAAVPTPNKGSVTPVATMKVTPKPVTQTNVPAATTPACCQKGGASAAGCSKTCSGDAKAATPASCNNGHANSTAPKTCDHANAPAAVPAKTIGQ